MESCCASEEEDLSKTDATLTTVIRKGTGEMLDKTLVSDRPTRQSNPTPLLTKQVQDGDLPT